MAKRNKDRLVESYSEDYFTKPDKAYKIINPTNETLTIKKLDNAEELLKNIYQWLLSNDSLDGEMEEEYAFRVINEIPATKELINKYFRDNI